MTEMRLRARAQHNFTVTCIEFIVKKNLSLCTRHHLTHVAKMRLSHKVVVLLLGLLKVVAQKENKLLSLFFHLQLEMVIELVMLSVGFVDLLLFEVFNLFNL